MKKLILISSTLFAFAFIVGCGDGKTTKEKCEEDDTKMWVEGEGDAEGECVDKVAEAVGYTITNKSSKTIAVVSGKTSYLAKDACVKVTEAQFAAIKISPEGLCDNSDKKTDGTANTENDCKVGHYEVQVASPQEGGGLTLEAVKEMSTSDNCRDLGAKPPKATDAEGGDNADSSTGS